MKPAETDAERLLDEVYEQDSLVYKVNKDEVALLHQHFNAGGVKWTGQRLPFRPVVTTVIQLLKYLRDEWCAVPRSKEGAKVAPPSNSELNRWCRKGSVMLNGIRVAPSDEVVFPVMDLVFFPKNDKQRCSLYYKEN